MNSITDKLYYVNENGDKANMRVIVSSPIPTPTTWQISKVENVNPYGLQRLTLAQDLFDPHRDYVNLETKEMYADYYSESSEPIHQDDMFNDITKETEQETINYKSTLTTSTATIKLGGSYKTLTFKMFNENNEDITDMLTEFQWEYRIDGKLVNDIILEKDTTTALPQKKIKFLTDINGKVPNASEYLGKSLDVQCIAANSTLSNIKSPILTLGIITT